MRPRMFAARAAGRPFALATIVAADGGPRPVGAQMVVTDRDAYGFLSGGCIEADVALHGRAALSSGAPRRLVYGRGSPFIDMRLPCGGRLEVLVERIPPDDRAVAELERLTLLRKVAIWTSDGSERACSEAVGPANGGLVFDPFWRLAVIGSDPFALAIADLAGRSGWETILIAPSGPQPAPPLAVAYSRADAPCAIRALAPDRWTAIAVATHDIDTDHDALVAALESRAGYVGALGARRRLPERIARLRAAKIAEDRLAQLHAPIGLQLGAANAQEVAVAVMAELTAHRRRHVLAAQQAAA